MPSQLPLQLPLRCHCHWHYNTLQASQYQKLLHTSICTYLHFHTFNIAIHAGIAIQLHAPQTSGHEDKQTLVHPRVIQANVCVHVYMHASSNIVCLTLQYIASRDTYGIFRIHMGISITGLKSSELSQSEATDGGIWGFCIRWQRLFVRLQKGCSNN